jgi:hypothetical protein
MYSPHIAEDLIPILYRTAKATRQPMTRLVDAFIRAGLAAMTAVPQPAALAADCAAQEGGA